MSQEVGLIIYVDLMVTEREERSKSGEEDSEPGLKSPMDEKEEAIDEPADGCNKGSRWHSPMLYVSKRPGSKSGRRNGLKVEVWSSEYICPSSKIYGDKNLRERNL